MAISPNRMTMTQPLTGMVAPKQPIMATGTSPQQTRMQMPNAGTPSMPIDSLTPAGIAAPQTATAQGQQQQGQGQPGPGFGQGFGQFMQQLGQGVGGAVGQAAGPEIGQFAGNAVQQSFPPIQQALQRMAMSRQQQQAPDIMRNLLGMFAPQQDQLGMGLQGLLGRLMQPRIGPQMPSGGTPPTMGM